MATGGTKNTKIFSIVFISSTLTVAIMTISKMVKRFQFPTSKAGFSYSNMMNLKTNSMVET